MNPDSLLAGSLQVLVILALEVTLVVLAVALLAQRARSAAWRRVFWQGGLIAVLALTAFELSGSGRVFAQWVADTLARQHEDRVSHSHQAQAPSPQLMPEFRSRVKDRLTTRNRVLSQTGAPTVPLGGPETVPLQDPEPQAGTVPPASSIPEPLAEMEADSIYVFLLWLAWTTGTGLVAARVCIGRCLLFVFRLRRRRVATPALLARARELSRALGIRRRLRLIESDRLHGPMAFGLIFPTVGLPRDFSTRFTPARQEAMLAHELAHLAAHDPFWSMLADFCAALLWWHPAVRWARRQFHLASEVAADEASLLLKNGPTVLAECLVEFGARVTGRELGQMQVSGLRSHLGQRVQRLLHLEARAWSPPPRLRAALLLTFGPLATAALVVLCTAWATPQALTKGNAMQSMQLTLKRSLAALALLTAFNDSAPAAVGADLAKPPSQPAVSGVPAANPAPNDAAMAAFRRRYGLDKQLAAPAPNPKRQKIETKLNEIMLPEIQFDGLPLSDVIRSLSDQAVKLDPEKKGINLLINCHAAPVAAPSSVDPATGLPLTAPPAEPIDVGSILVRFSLPLRHVSLKDALEAIVRVAERPLEYSIEDYGVVVSVKADVRVGQPLLPRASSAPERLFASTFKVDTNTFLAGLENAFGIAVPKSAPGQSKAEAREIQAALRALLAQLGVGGGDAKTVFYNDLTGIIMVRATAEEQGVIQAAMETLGGTPVGSYGGGGGFGMSTFPGGR